MSAAKKPAARAADPSGRENEQDDDRDRSAGPPRRRHIMLWAPQDWLSSPLRGELALERDHLARLVYLEILGILHERGGFIPAAEVAGAVLVTGDEAERALARLLRSGRLETADGGLIASPRVLRDLGRDAAYRRAAAEHGRRGATRRWGEDRAPHDHPIGSDDATHSFRSDPIRSDPNRSEPEREREEPAPGGAARARGPHGGEEGQKRTRTPPPDRLPPDVLERLRASAAGSKNPATRQLAGRIDELVAQALDHYRAKGEERADWVATVRTWIRREASGAFRRTNGATAPDPPARARGTRAEPVSASEILARVAREGDT